MKIAQPKLNSKLNSKLKALLPSSFLVQKNLYFKFSSRVYSNKKPLHHGSFWYYLSQQQWDNYIDQIIAPIQTSLTDQARVFEVGMGCGAVLKRVNQRFPMVKLTGVDPEKKSIKLANKFLPSGNYTVANGLDLKNTDSCTYDIVLAHCVIIYLKDLFQVKQFCNEMLRVAKPGAKVVITSMVDEQGKMLGTGQVRIPKSWWSENLQDLASIDKLVTIGQLPGCEHQQDRYAVYLTKL